MNQSVSTNDADDSSDLLASVISDVEEEGEIPEPQEEDHSKQTIADTLSEEIADGSDELSASDELVSAMARHLQIIEAAMRQHETTGTLRFHDDDADTQTDEDPASNGSKSSLIGDMLQDPGAAFAATIPRQNRLALLSLLAN